MRLGKSGNWGTIVRNHEKTSPLAYGQVLYEELFPYNAAQGSGDQPISAAGWANDVPANPNPNRLFQRLFPDGAVFAYQAGGNTTAFYTTTALDTGATGMAFTSINPLLFPAGIALSVDIDPGFSADEIATRFAVQIGSSWYAAATALSVPLVGDYVTYSLTFDPTASGWNTLTLNGTSATIGGVAPGNLTGNITGAGLVVTHGLNDGTHDFDNFRISVVPEPTTAMLLGLGGLLLIRRIKARAV